MEADAVEGGVGAAFGLWVGSDDAPDWTAAARRLATLVGCCRVLLVGI
jgi:hypothetical protein